jgi:AraC-like DNA-binding protein
MHRKPADISRHQQIFGCPVRFDMPVTQTVMSARALTTSLAQADPHLAGYLERQADAMLDAVPIGRDLATGVRSALRAERRLGAANAERTARRLGLSVRTLSRRLREEGTGYRAIYDELRAERARQQLAQTDRAIAEIADQLGFANPQSFQRAFRRWSGTSAARYRAQFSATGTGPLDDDP